MTVKYLDVIDLFCQFSDKLELAANEPSLDFMKRRMDFLQEEVEELEDGLAEEDLLETIDGAADVAFVAITQIYHGFRSCGFDHVAALVKTRTTLLLVGKANMAKNIPTKPGEKITKPEGWKSPNEEIENLINPKPIKTKE